MLFWVWNKRHIWNAPIFIVSLDGEKGHLNKGPGCKLFKHYGREIITILIIIKSYCYVIFAILLLSHLQKSMSLFFLHSPTFCLHTSLPPAPGRAPKCPSPSSISHMAGKAEVPITHSWSCAALQALIFNCITFFIHQPWVLELIGFQPRLIGGAPTGSWLAAFD